MPNYVYSSITFHNKLTEKQEEIMKQIVDLECGLCEYYKPMPKEIRNTTAPHDKFNWYDWALAHWNTKWGTIYNVYNGELFTFASAWDLPSQQIFEMFAKDFPNFDLDYEEEQGWGGRIVFENGEIVSRQEYDAPEWSEVGESEDGYVTKLVHMDECHPRFHDVVIGGYYLDYCLDIQILDKEITIKL